MAWIINQLKKIGWWYRDYTFRQSLYMDSVHIPQRKTIRQHKDDFVAWVKGLTVDKIIVFLVFATIALLVGWCQAGIPTP